MIEKKNFVMAIKRALETGTFNFVGQEAKAFPDQIWRIDELRIDDQNWWECNPISKVDVSNNDIPAIPEGIAALADLQLLRMKNNQVAQIPAVVLSLPLLKSLDLSRNRLTSLPKETSLAPSLVELNLSENLLEACPNLDQVKTLEVVFLNSNRLKSLPNFGSCLKKAELSENQVRRVYRQNFCRCTNLESLCLNKNQIQEIEEGTFANSANMVSLELKQNRLQTFRELPQSQKLDTITVSFNRLTEFSEFDKCPNLTVLILSDNKIKSLSRNIIRLKKLKTLDIANNDLSDLPCEIGFLNSLVRIQLEGNPLKTMRQNVRTGGTNVVKKYLQEKMDPKEREAIEKSSSSTFEKVSDNQHWAKLIQQFTQGGELLLRKMNLTHLDELVFSKNLKGINISDNKVSSISQNIYKLDQLKYIIVNNNELSLLPNSLERLPNLEQIEAKQNLLTEFPVTSPYAFPKLHYLDLSANRLRYIPKGILVLPKLRTLNIAYNQISEIEILLQRPEAVPLLEVLDLSNNKIEDISGKIWNRVSLNYLNIENNNLSKVPTVLGFMKLNGLKIDGNPLKLIKRAVIDKGTVAIMEYLRTRHEGQVPAEPQGIIPVQKQQYVLKPEKPNYPYETEHKLVKNVQAEQTHAQKSKQKQQQVKELEAEIKKLQDELDNNMGLSMPAKNQKKKAMQSLMIERNKLLKQQ